MARATTETELLNNVLEAAAAFGWRTAHFRPAQTSKGWRTAVSGDGKGFPDLVLVRDRVIFAELKRETEPLKPEQDDWGLALLFTKAEYYVWRPSDWLEGRIDRALAPLGLKVA